MRCESDGASGKDALRVISGSHRIRRSLAGHCGRSWEGEREIRVGVGGMGTMGSVRARGDEEKIKTGGRGDIPLLIAMRIRVFRGGSLRGVREEGRGVVEVCDETTELVWDGDGRKEEM